MNVIDYAQNQAQDALEFARRTGSAVRRTPRLRDFDSPLMIVLSLLLAVGVLMVASASMPVAAQNMATPWHYLIRQSLYLLAGLTVFGVMVRVPTASWRDAGPYLLLSTILLLILVLIPGVGVQVNGAVRWIGAGPIRIQVSELGKLFVIVYIAGYLVRHPVEVRSGFGGFARPMLLVMLISLLLLMEPDFGSASIIVGVTLAMLFLGGVQLRVFVPLFIAVAGIMALLIRFEPYRWARLTNFLDPWKDPYNGGYQLTQSLIAIGRGDWAGVGIGNSMQKLLYLPEAHTDFVFAIYAEEFGFLGSVALIALYAFLVWRGYRIGAASERVDRMFGAYCAYGVSFWLGVQAFVNFGVNMGVLPTKGLTLPLISYGGSSLLVTSAALALLLRVDYERRELESNARGGTERESYAKLAAGGVA